MTRRIYEVDFAGCPVRFAFQYPQTKRSFGRYLRRSEADTYDVMASPEFIEEARSLLPVDSPDGYVEYRCLIGPTSQVLLKSHRSLFHAVAFIFREKAWLLTAPSGVGKTTQYLNWQRLFPGETAVICGDMPALRLEEDGRLSVHPSPWNGKERFGSSLSAPLGGVVFLERGSVNKIKMFPPEEALLPLIGQFMVLPETEEEISLLLKLLTAMMERYPLCRFVNLGDDASTALLRHWMETTDGTI